MQICDIIYRGGVVAMDKNKKTLYFEIGSLVFCLVFGTLNHFIFEWSGDSLLVAPFVPVNESVWEHGKLLFAPFLLYAVVEYFFLKDNPNYLFAKALPLVVSIPLMIIAFYTYTGILGYNITALDITLAMAIIIAMNVVSYKLLTSGKEYSSKTLTVLVAIILGMIILFTFLPPQINLFLDTTNQTYGIG